MKKRFLYAAVSFLFLASTAFVIIKNGSKHKSRQAVSLQLLPRKSSLAYSNEWPNVQKNAAGLLNKIRQNENDIKSLNTLAALFLQEARITGNFGYYNKAVLECVNRVLEREPANFEALSFKTTVFLSKHMFTEALIVGKQLQEKFPYNAYVYGMLVDANVELGNYKEAIDAADKMISLRPDIRSYSRIAYLREIHGDIPGAIDAMKLAVSAGAPGDENTEWCRVQVGKLYEQSGKIKEAEMQYNIALGERENFPAAIIGLARIATAQKDYQKALSFYMQADSISADHTIKEGFAEVYSLMNETGKAKEAAEKNLEHMLSFSKDGNEDLEIAHAYMAVDNYEKALEHAMIEYKRRPNNIEANETVALVYYKKNQYTKAVPFIEASLNTNCKKPELLCNAGMIYAKAGDKVKAKMYLQEALKNDPLIPASVKKESKEMLNSWK